MLNAFNNINVLEILRVGLAGLCFLLSLLAFWLIHREQQRAANPRKGILRAIYTFMGVNFLTAVLVAAAGYLTPQQRATASEELSATTYMTDKLSYTVDLTKWREETRGPVEITRVDNIKKVSNTPDDYVIPYFTTASNPDALTAKFLSSSRPVDFVPDRQPGFAGQHFLYKIHLGDQPKDASESAATMFTFIGGFKDPKKEVWEASISYPSRIVSVVMLFPENKPCKKIEVSQVQGIRGDKLPLTKNKATTSQDGLIVQWTGLNIAERTRIHFEWEW